jgi:ABC-type phosphate transport system auxiliary subunit
VGCAALTIAGGTLEVFGFGLIAYDLYRIQRHEYGTPQFLERWKGRIRRLLRMSKDHTLHVDAAVGTVDMAGRIKVRSGVGEDADLKERISVLEKNFERLDEEVDEHRAAFDKGLNEMREELRAARAELEQRHQETEQERKTFQRTSVTLQACGTVLFVLGTLFSVLGSVVN